MPRMDRISSRYRYESFGPIVVVTEGDDETPKAKCSVPGRTCSFLRNAGSMCSHAEPARAIDDPGGETPDWCAMKASAMRDVAEMIAADNKRRKARA